MKIKNLFLVVLVMFMSGFIHAQQPYSGCWHPDFIRDWTPEKDPDAKFNRSSIPLQPRIQEDVVKANRSQFRTGQIAACLTMHPSCSQVPAQGANNFIGYNPSYWQYLDILVWWGGSAGEGIILPPSAPVIDAAHLSGVKVLGQVFFPTKTHGGQEEWTHQMLTQENGQFPYARKLVEIAEYYGFDGWFINDETLPGQMTEWNDFVKDYLKYAKEKGLEEHEIQYYCMTWRVPEKYFPMFKEKNASYFVNYGGLHPTQIEPTMNRHANDWGLGMEDAFKTYYYGIEQSGSHLANANYYQFAFPKTGHSCSMQIFNPEENIWKKVVGPDGAGLLNTNKDCGEEAYEAMEEVFKREARFWTNAQNNPADDTDRDNSTNWPGLANAIIERSAIQNLPFVSSFSGGLGKYRFVNGEKKGEQDWYHRGMQTVMPTWRWWIEKQYPQAEINMSLNFDDAYNMGNSISVKGKLKANADNVVRLYKTKLDTSKGGKIQVVYKTNTEGSITLKLGLSTLPGSLRDFPLTSTSTQNGWNIAEVNLEDLSGMELGIIGLGFKHNEDVENYEATLGQIAIYPKSYNPATTSVSNLKIENQLNETKGNLRVVWDKPESEDIHHFNVYLERNGKKSLVGQTRNEGFFIPTFDRESPAETEVKVYITTVNKDMKEGNEVSVEAKFPAIQLPTVQLKASKTLIKIGEEVEFTAQATSFPTDYTWSVPEGATLVSSDKNTAKFKFNQEGLYDISINVKNTVGNTDFTEKSLIKVSNSEELNLVSVGAIIKEVSGSLPPEDPEWLVDGEQVPGNVRNKWCTGGSKEHWVVIDLKEIYEIYRFQWFDCGNKENYSDNTKFYKIYTSNTANGKDWSLVVDESDRPENTKDDYVKPTIGRYIKFVPYDPETPITIRIWEFEVYALKPTIGMEQPSDISLEVDETEDITITFTYVSKGEDFNISVEQTEEDILEISTPEIDETNKLVKFTLKGLEEGSSEIKVKLINNTQNIERSFLVTVIPATGIEEKSSDDKVSVWPNPVSKGDDLNITGNNITTVRLYSMQGALLQEQSVTISHTTISTDGLPQGTYLLQVISENEVKTTKVIIK